MKYSFLCRLGVFCAAVAVVLLCGFLFAQDTGPSQSYGGNSRSRPKPISQLIVQNDDWLMEKDRVNV